MKNSTGSVGLTSKQLTYSVLIHHRTQVCSFSCTFFLYPNITTRDKWVGSGWGSSGIFQI